MAVKPFRLLPQMSRQRGLPSIGVEVPSVDGMEMTPVMSGETVLRCSETRDGKIVGELEVTVFRAALVIDRDGILEAKASESLGGAHAVPVVLPGATGFRAQRVEHALYRYAFAIAPNDLAVDGGLLVTLRCARPDWPAADRLLRSLRILTRHGSAPANDVGEDAAVLPLVSALKRNE